MNSIDPSRFDDAHDRLRADADAAGEYLTVEEVAAMARCEHKAVRRAVARGDLVAFRPGQRLLIRPSDARTWIEARPARRPAPEPRRSRARNEPGSVARLREIERDST